MGNTEKYHYTDSELVEILEENGYEVSYKEVEKLRAGIESGDILIGNFLSEEEENELATFLSSLTEEEYAANKELCDTLLEKLQNGEPIEEGLVANIQRSFIGRANVGANPNYSALGHTKLENMPYHVPEQQTQSAGNPVAATKKTMAKRIAAKKKGSSTTPAPDPNQVSTEVVNKPQQSAPQAGAKVISSGNGNTVNYGNVTTGNIGSGNKFISQGGNGSAGIAGGNATGEGAKAKAKMKVAGDNTSTGGNGGDSGNISNNNNFSNMRVGGVTGDNKSNNSVNIKEGNEEIIVEASGKKENDGEVTKGNIGSYGKYESKAGESKDGSQGGKAGDILENNNFENMDIGGIVSTYLESERPYSHKEIINTCMKYCLTEADENSICGVTVFMEKVEKEIKKQEEEKANPEVVEEPVQDAASDQVSMPGKSITITPDGSLEVATVDKQITLTNDGVLNVSLAESRQRVSRTNYILESYLTEDCGMTNSEYQSLTEETKVESLRELAIEVLKAIEEKLQSADTSCADRSRGDIKKLVELPAIQDAITKLEALIERDENSSPMYTQYVGTIIKSILYINQYSAVFKDAYRNKKTLMILKYESLILAIVASISYALATIVDYKANQISLKKLPNEDLMNFAPFKTLENFNRSVDSGEFKIVAGDVAVLREFFLEVPVEQMSLVLEANDYMPLIVNGVRGVLSALDDNSGKISSYIYKAVGIIILIFSLREVIYAISKMKTKTSEMLSMISNFANLNNGGGMLSKLLGAASKFRSDAETGSDLSQREIEDENRRMATKVRGIQASSVLSEPKEDTSAALAAKVGASEPADDIFGFDF